MFQPDKSENKGPEVENLTVKDDGLLSTNFITLHKLMHWLLLKGSLSLSLLSSMSHQQVLRSISELAIDVGIHVAVSIRHGKYYYNQAANHLSQTKIGSLHGS